MEIDRIAINDELIRPQILSLREFRPFKSSDEYLWAMKEDLSDWLNLLYPDLNITPHTFMACLETGLLLCKHANNVRCACSEWLSSGRKLPKCWGKEWKLPTGEVIYNANARPETFFSRDNVHNFITWCRRLGIFECLLFESDDLILRKNEKNVILCLLEVARRGSHFGMAAPLLVQFEKEIDRDIAKDAGLDLSSSSEEEESYIEYGPPPQIITNDLRSLDEMVRELVERCTCPTQFQMIRVAEGKYRIGNTKMLIYVRILKNHVMVRVGGGWDTLDHFLQKHDPCKCTSGHRATISSRFTMKNNDGKTPKLHRVEYERRDLSSSPFDTVHPSSQNSFSNNITIKKPTTAAADLSDSSSEISDEGYKSTSDNLKTLIDLPNRMMICGSNLNNIKETSNSSSISKNDQIRNKIPLVRAHSLSTDEDRPDSRPDSRSTDEENGVQQIQIQQRNGRDRQLSKSSSAGRVPKNSYTLARSNSCERPSITDSFSSKTPSQHTFPRYRNNSGEQHSSSISSSNSSNRNNNNMRFPGRSVPLNSKSNGIVQSPPIPSILKSNHFYGQGDQKIYKSKTLERIKPTPIRSRSAGGSSDFFLNSRSRGNSSSANGCTPKTSRNHSTLTSGSGYHQRNNIVNNNCGKNTWNGSGSSQQQQGQQRVRVRPDLFQVKFQDHQNNSKDNMSSERGSVGLAGWIKQALELDSDADKISYIEKAIKEYEIRDSITKTNNNSKSLPSPINNDLYNSNNEIDSFSSVQSTPVMIRKRKENGVTRIPKPNFY